MNRELVAFVLDQNDADTLQDNIGQLRYICNALEDAGSHEICLLNGTSYLGRMNEISNTLKHLKTKLDIRYKLIDYDNDVCSVRAFIISLFGAIDDMIETIINRNGELLKTKNKDVVEILLAFKDE